jgi:hypothetical protein
VVAALLIYRIVDFMFTKYGNTSKCDKQTPCASNPEKLADAVDIILSVDFKKMEERQKTMYDLHNVKDREGVPIWYVRSSLEEAIKKLVTAIENQTMLVSALVHEVRGHMARTDVLRRPPDARECFTPEDPALKP